MRAYFTLLLLCGLTLAQQAAAEPMSVLCPKFLNTEARRRACHLKSARAFNELAMEPNTTLGMQIADSFIADTVVWRTDPVGTFAGKAMVAEYLSILSSPTGPATLVQAQQAVFRCYANQGNLFMAAVDILFLNVLNGNVANMSFAQTYEFSPLTNRVVNVDMAILRYPLWIDALALYDLFTPEIAVTALMQPVCNTAAKYCNTPALQQYTNTLACMDFMKNTTLYNKEVLQSNTVTCRFIHSGMVAIAPEIHCPHIGPTGGGACVDQDYTAYFNVFPPGTFTP